MFGIVLFVLGCAAEQQDQGAYADFGGFSSRWGNGAGQSDRWNSLSQDVQSGGELADTSQDAGEDGSAIELETVGSGEEDASPVAGDAHSDGDDGVESAGDATPLVGGSLGSSCSEDSPCEEGLTCEPWPAPDGVCTILDCRESGCPEGGTCIQFDATRWGCMPGCSSSGDCRDGDSCKTLRIGGGFQKVCHAIGANPVKEAGLCSYSADCQGKMACMKDFAGGYCAQLDCNPAKPCPIGTGCYAVSDYNACMKICDPSKPCPGGLVGIQVCESAELVTGDQEDICLEEVEQEVGEFCKNGDECASGKCQLTSTGYCENGLGPCLTEKDCGDNPCIPSDEVHLWYMCGGVRVRRRVSRGTVCVPLSSGTGECMKDCKSLSDVVTCGSSASCEYGFRSDPLWGGGGGLCVPAQGRWAAGDACTNADDCSGGLTCFQAPGGGLCAETCGGLLPTGLNYCSWGGTCVSALSTSQCLPLCPKGNVQCEDGFSCQTKFVGVPFTMDVCLPE